MSVVENNFYSFPFSFSAFDKEENIKLKQKIPNFKTTMKMGLGECVKNDLLHGYPVLTEKKGEIVAEFTYTIAVRNEGPIVISGLNLDLDQFESDKKITDEEIKKIINFIHLFILYLFILIKIFKIKSQLIYCRMKSNEKFIFK